MSGLGDSGSFTAFSFSASLLIEKCFSDSQMEGVLSVKKRKRWFVLGGRTLSCYKSDNCEKMLYLVNLTDVTSVSQINVKTFSVCTSQTELVLQTPSPKVQDEWIGAIQTAIISLKNSISGGSSEQVVSLDNFEMMNVIGKGAFGKVVQVRERKTGDVYAMKILQKSYVVEKDEVQRTNSERNVLARASHPFIMKLHYAFQTPEKLYFVMDFATGGELFFHLRKSKRFSEERARFYAAQVWAGIHYLHQRGIIYRDLKPENLLLDADGNILITDFGLSKENMMDQTTESFVGTPDYVAPEILHGGEYDMTVDWWSLGILIFEMLIGEPPFYGDSFNQLFRAIKTEEVKFFKRISEPAMSLIIQLLEKEPALRLSEEDIIQHEWFADIDLELLLTKQLEPPYKPDTSIDITKNISKEFLKMDVNEERDDGRGVDHDNLFANFTYSAKRSNDDSG